MTKERNECAEACLEAHKSALQTVKACLKRGGGHAQTAHLLLLIECAQLCDTCAQFCIHDSARAVVVAEACAKVCEQAAAHCARFEDSEMTQCAEVCLYCAQRCYSVVHAVPA